MHILLFIQAWVENINTFVLLNKFIHLLWSAYTNTMYNRPSYITLSQAVKSLIIWSNFNECILFTLLLFNHWLILIKKLIISTKLTIPLDSHHYTPNKWNETTPTLFSRVRICSTVFIFVTFDYVTLQWRFEKQKFCSKNISIFYC